MSYVRKNIQSVINNADACGGGMKKQGLVYGSEWVRVTRGNTNSDGRKVGHLAKKGPKDYVFTLPGQAVKTCCSTQVRAVITYTSVRGRNMTG